MNVLKIRDERQRRTKTASRVMRGPCAEHSQGIRRRGAGAWTGGEAVRIVGEIEAGHDNPAGVREELSDNGSRRSIPCDFRLLPSHENTVVT